MVKPTLNLGCTSFVIPAGWADNVRFIAKQKEAVRHIELQLCLADEDLSDTLPEAQVGEIARLCADHGIQCSAHLPVNIDLTRAASSARDTDKMLRLLDRVAPLNLRALTLHVEPAGTLPADWIDHAAAAVTRLAKLAPCPLCIENIEGTPPDFHQPLFARLSPAHRARCLDIGHLWKDRLDPAPILAQWRAQVRHIHLHGLFGRDHRSLAHMNEAQVDSVLHPLLAARYGGIVTLEVFSWADFTSSRHAALASIERFHA